MSDDGTEPCPECKGERFIYHPRTHCSDDYQSRCGTCGGDGRVPDAAHTEYLVSRELIEQAIDALHQEAEAAEGWRGRRDYRIDRPLATATALRAIIGPTPEPTEAERAEALARMNAYLAERFPHLARQAGEGE